MSDICNETRGSDATERELAKTSDEQLLELVGKAGHDAFKQLYARYERTSYGLALRVLRDHALAEDAVVEAMLGVWRGAARYDARQGAARVWILTLVHRRAVDLVRREQRHRSRADDAELEERESRGGGDEGLLADERLRVQQALRELPKRERDLLILAYYDGYTQSELSSKLGISLGTVKSRMFTGLARLRRLLTEPAPVAPVGAPDERGDELAARVA